MNEQQRALTSAAEQFVAHAADVNRLYGPGMLDYFAEIFGEALAKPQPVGGVLTETVEFHQFLSDAMTAAGLVRHGKKSAALAERLSDGCMKFRAPIPTPDDDWGASPEPDPKPAMEEADYRRGYRDGYNRRDDEVKGALA